MADKKISALTGASTPLAGTEVLPIVKNGATVKVAVSDLTAGRTVAMASLGVGTAATATRLVNIASTAGVAPLVAVGPNAYLLIDNVGNGTNIYSSNVAHVFEGVSGGNILTLDSVSKNVSVTSGNIAMSTSGKGIDFSATPGTGTSELLADYEEGTFTATLTPNTSGSITLSSNNTLAYTKVGRVVVVNGLIDVASVSAPVGTYVLLTTLPFTPATISPNAGRSGGAFGVLATSLGNITPSLLINSGLATTYIAMTAATVQAGTSFYVEFAYIA